MTITTLADDSRQVRPGTLFIVRPGVDQDGSQFIDQAVQAGAVALAVPSALVGHPSTLKSGLPVLEMTHITDAVASIADAFYDHPTSHLRMVGITGTNGKTTLANVYQQLSRAAGRRCGLLGTISMDDGATVTESHLTTPGRIELTDIFARMVRNRCDDAVMEASSHALVQGRVAGLAYDCAVFTNLSGDHLDYHGTMDIYADAKAMLFESLSAGATAIVNVDDPASARMIRSTQARVLTCGIVREDASCWAKIRSVSSTGTTVDLHGPWGLLELKLPLIGSHNVMNALQAAAAAWSQGIRAAVIGSALESCHAPAGRLQPASQANDDCSVFVDYAHTDDALRNVLTAVRSNVPSGAKLIVLFGCGGDRDTSKRPRMAAVACELADEVWITSDNPRTENPLDIINDIQVGVGAASGSCARVHTEPDRALAIARVIAEARAGDLIVIAGKGHEHYQIIGTEKRPFDDLQVARSALDARAKATIR